MAASPWKITGWICAGIVAASVIACIAMAVGRSDGLSSVTVTALPGTKEPRDHGVPFVKQKEALPDYELTLVLADGERVNLGAKPDTSAAEGLTWEVERAVSTHDIASVRLDEQDKLVSDAVSEPQFSGESLTQDGYRFDFTSERSVSVGVQSFFGTPIGKAIAAAFFIAILLIIFSAWNV
jgi:hypothetical protein